MKLNPTEKDIRQNQNAKEDRFNAIMDAVDRMLNGVVTVDASGGDLQLTEAQSWGNGMVELTGSPASAFNVDMPDAVARRLAVRNATGQTATMRNSTGAGATLDIPAGSSALFHYDGTDVIVLSAAGATGVAEQVEHFEPGTPTGGALIYEKTAARGFSVDADLAGSQGHAGTAPAGDTTYSVTRNGLEVATVTFGSGSQAPTALSTIAERALALPFDDADGATSTTDFGPTGYAVTFVGNAQIDTAQFKYGTASLLLDGTGDYVAVLDSADWTFDGEFTVHAWVRPGAIGTQIAIVTHYQSDGDDRSWQINVQASGNIRATLSTNGSSNTTIDSASTLSANTWYHVALTRDASDAVRLFIDGVLEGGPTTVSGTLHNSTDPLRVGATGTGGGTGDHWDGHIDEVEIIKGHALWTAAFTPPELGVRHDYRTWPAGSRLGIVAPAALNGIADVALSLDAQRIA